MTDKNRNFRSSYYDKVGFRGVEEKKSLEILISEKPLDKSKLSKFCLRFTLPSVHREYVWQILLDVISVNPESHQSMIYQRSEHYNELRHSLTTMRKITDNTTEPVVYALLYLMTQEMLMMNLQQQLKEQHTEDLIAVALVFHEISSSDMIGYFMFRNFILSQRQNSVCFKSLKEHLENILKKEDLELYNRLKYIQALKIIPTDLWFERYFAEVLHPSSLARVWDKVIGGACKILAFVGASMLITLRHHLLTLEKPEGIVQFLKKIPEETSDVVVNKALDLYYS